jgi:hypothetical protein
MGPVEVKSRHDPIPVGDWPALPYQPEVGDVVEFEWGGRALKGIAFGHGGSKNLDIAIHNPDGAVYTASNAVSIKKIGSTSKMDGVEYYTEANPVVMAYFAQPTFTGTYAERQAQWVAHHNLKVGDKVKVVRGFKDGDDGARIIWYDNKKMCTGKTYTIRSMAGGVRLDTGIRHVSWFPYTVLEPVKD